MSIVQSASPKKEHGRNSFRFFAENTFFQTITIILISPTEALQLSENTIENTKESTQHSEHTITLSEHSSTEQDGRC